MFTLCFFSPTCQLDYNGILEIRTLHQHSKYAVLCKVVFLLFFSFFFFFFSWLYSFDWNWQVARLNPDKSIPLAILKGAKGLAILTVAKAGVLLAYKLGTGLVISRRSDGSWSAPSAIFCWFRMGCSGSNKIVMLLLVFISFCYYYYYNVCKSQS